MEIPFLRLFNQQEEASPIHIAWDTDEQWVETRTIQDIPIKRFMLKEKHTYYDFHGEWFPPMITENNKYIEFCTMCLRSCTWTSAAAWRCDKYCHTRTCFTLGKEIALA